MSVHIGLDAGFFALHDEHRFILRKLTQHRQQSTLVPVLPSGKQHQLCHGCLQRALQTEARRSAESLQRLPALLAAALPVMDVTPAASAAGGRQRTQPAAPGGPAGDR